MTKKELSLEKESRHFDFHGLKRWVQQGEYIMSICSADGTIWTYATNDLPIFDFRTTKIFQAQESGIAEVQGIENGEELFFSIQGISVTKIYDFLDT